MKINPVEHITYDNPYFEIVYNYMIGDADGETTCKCEVSVDNPYLDRYGKLMNKLLNIKGFHSLYLDDETLDKFLEEGKLSEEDVEWLKIIFNPFDYEYEKEKETGEPFVVDKALKELSDEGCAICNELNLGYAYLIKFSVFYYDSEGKHTVTFD